jgi:GTP-binding protein
VKPTVVLVGRPNVGKSTLFNRLTRSRDAIVHDLPGLTRDRHYGQGRLGGKPYIVVDTGGLEAVAKDGILHEMARQTMQAVDEADAVVMLVDARQGLTPHDRTVAERLRRTGRTLWLAVNKAEGIPSATAAAEFHELGLGDPLPISAAHGEGVRELMEHVLAHVPEAAEEEPEPGRHPRIAVVGRPNVGKSTLVNALVGEERVIAFDQPGTTRDSIDVEFQRDGRTYTLVDTAGVRRRGRVEAAVEKFSVLKTLQSVEEANVVILVLDARQDISDQDAHLAGFVLEAGRALVVAINKWDGLEPDVRERVKRDYARKLGFLDFARVHHVSALRGSGLGPLLRSADAAYAAAMAKLSTPKLTRVLLDAVAAQAPPRAGMSRPKLRYAHQGGSNPPVIVIHGNALDQVPDSYRRFLERRFIDSFGLVGTPLRIQFRTSRNPFAEKAS